jgi:hypothetical protein
MNNLRYAALLLGLGTILTGCASPARRAAARPQSVEVLPQWNDFVQKNYQDEVRSRLNTPDTAEILHSPIGIGSIYYPDNDYTSLFAVVPVIPNPIRQRIRQDMIIRWWAPGNATGDPSAPWKSDRWGVPPPQERDKSNQ